MQARRILAASALAVAMTACAPSVPKQQPPSSVTIAQFDPTKNEIPLPNALVLQQDPSTLGVPPAQADLLNAFKAQGGFPNDQEVPITIGFAKQLIGSDGKVTNQAPELDFSSFGPSTFLVYGSSGQASGLVPMETPQASDFATVDDGGGQSHGVLTLHHQGRAPWAPGNYVVAVRGGPNGIKTKDGSPVYASQIFSLIASGQDLTTEQNLSLLAATAGSRQAAMPLAQELNLVSQSYTPAFAVVNTAFPQQELAILDTFPIAPAVTQVELDPARGLAPLPIDLLRDPRPASASCAECGKLTPLAACTLAAGQLDANGNCSSSAAAGFQALDGFSTTAPILAPTSDLVEASTVTPSTAMLFEVSGTTATLVDPTTYVTEPCELTQSGFSTAVVLAPAGATGCDASSVFRTRPLKDATTYAVVLTDGIKDKTGHAIGAGTVGKILLFQNAVVDASGKSQLEGVDDQTAGALEVMRQQLQPVVAAVETAGTTRDHIAMAYTFKTQTILATAAKLAMLPYGQPDATAAPGDVSSPALTAAEAFAKYGVDPAVPSSNIGQVFETTITTFNLIDPVTGAFLADATQAAAEQIKVLVVQPKNNLATACAGALGSMGLKCAPMMIFRHGLGGGRADALLVADSFAAKGMVTVAIDAWLHGDRSFCSKGTTTTTVPGVGTENVCNGGAACASTLPAGAQGDANPPGSCGNAGFAKHPVSGSCGLNPASCGYTGADGIPWVSSNFLVSANFFRTRDALRQDIIDESQLVRALVFVPSGAPPTGHKLFDAMAPKAGNLGGVIIDPTLGNVFYTGQSLGAIQGTADVAANPRITKAVLNVGGGTIVDLFTQSPAFAANTQALLAGLGIAPGSTAYLQFLSVAKLVLDPADPVNFAGHLTGNTLPNLFPADSPFAGNPDGSVAQGPKSVLEQVAYCDQVVPNPFNYLWASTTWASSTGVTPMPTSATPSFFVPGTTGTFQLYYKGTQPAPADLQTCPAPGSSGTLPATRVDHGFFTDWTDPTAAGDAQSAAAAFLLSNTKPSSVALVP